MGIRNTRLSNLNTGQKSSNACSYGWAPIVRKIIQSKDRNWPCFQIGQSVNQWLNSTTHTHTHTLKEKSPGNFSQVVDCLFILSCQWQSFILGQNTVTHVSNGGSRSKEGSLQRDSLTSIRLYFCMAYNYHDGFLFHFLLLLLCFLIHCMVKKKQICLLSQWKYELPKPVYAFIIYLCNCKCGMVLPWVPGLVPWMRMLSYTKVLQLHSCFPNFSPQMKG